MPELPEVQTTVSILNRKIKNLSILDVWTDYNSPFNYGKGNIKDTKYFPYFKKEVIGKKILGVERRGKNVLINVSGNHEKAGALVARRTILVHMKMTGHLLYGKYEYKNNKWLPPMGSTLADPYNRFIHVAFSLSDKNTLVLSDARKFAKVFVFETDKIHELVELEKLGPDPLDKNFTYKVFKKRVYKKPNGKIKTVLMDQEVIAGIGNIYSDEVLWQTCLHPETRVKKIDESKLKILYKSIIKILKHSIKVGGDSMSDYRNPNGEKGGFQLLHKVYKKVGEKCDMRNCHGIIKRIKVGGRSAHFCDVHQK